MGPSKIKNIDCYEHSGLHVCFIYLLAVLRIFYIDMYIYISIYIYIYIQQDQGL